MKTLIATLIIVTLSTTPSSFGAEPNDAPAADREARAQSRPFWGTVVKSSDESLTVTPEPRAASRRGGPPPKPEDRTFALAKDKTELAYAEVGMERPMFDGTMMRTLMEPEPAAASDLKPGQLVQITPGEDAAAPAKRVIITWSVAGTIVKVDGESITLRPAPKRIPPSKRGDKAAADEPPAPADDQTIDLEKSTRIRIASITDQRPVPGGNGGRIQTTISYRDGELADLKPGQSVVVCIKDDVARKITIHEAKAETAGGKSD